MQSFSQFADMATSLIIIDNVQSRVFKIDIEMSIA